MPSYLVNQVPSNAYVEASYDLLAASEMWPLMSSGVSSGHYLQKYVGMLREKPTDHIVIRFNEVQLKTN